jgi:hypothetical protein
MKTRHRRTIIFTSAASLVAIFGWFPTASSASAGSVKHSLSIGRWVLSTSFNQARASLQSVTWKDWIYVIGGYAANNATSNNAAPKPTPFDDVQYAHLTSNGTIDFEGWKYTKPFTTPRWGHRCVVYNNFLYVIGGYDGSHYLGDTQWAKLDPNDGTINPDGWKSSHFVLKIARADAGVAVFKSGDQVFIYVVGGIGKVNGQTVPLDTTEFAEIDPSTGVIGQWIYDDDPIDHARCLDTVVAVHVHGSDKKDEDVRPHGELYLLGGLGATHANAYGDVQTATINDSHDSNGSVRCWASEPIDLATPRYAHGTIVVSNSSDMHWIVVAGGSDEKNNCLNSIEWAQVDSTYGGLNHWTPLPHEFSIARSNHATVWNGKYMLILGGLDRKNNCLDDVEVAPIRINED